MSYFFFDTSALVKRYMQEQGSAWVLDLTDPQKGNSIVLAEITIVEAAAAVLAARKHPDATFPQQTSAMLIHR